MEAETLAQFGTLGAAFAVVLGAVQPLFKLLIEKFFARGENFTQTLVKQNETFLTKYVELTLAAAAAQTNIVSCLDKQIEMSKHSNGLLAKIDLNSEKAAVQTAHIAAGVERVEQQVVTMSGKQDVANAASAAKREND